MIELHSHSTFSDGTLTPEELVKAAAAVGVKALALTDHDTTGGVPRLLAAAEAAGIRALPGVEVSADPPPGGTLHILGYGVRHTDPFLQEHLRWIREGRNERNAGIIQRLNQLGLRITLEEVRAYASDDVVARPHIARALQERGYIRTKREAFDKYLARGKPAYVERRRLSAPATLELIRRSGGVPVLAHPLSLKMDRDARRAYIQTLTDQGLGGIECWYPDHTPTVRKENLRMARDFGLIPAGGSDFHGAAKYQANTLGSMPVPDETIDLLLAAAAKG